MHTFDMFDNARRAKLSYFIVHTRYTQYRVYVIEPPFMDQQTNGSALLDYIINYKLEPATPTVSQCMYDTFTLTASHPPPLSSCNSHLSPSPPSLTHLRRQWVPQVLEQVGDSAGEDAGIDR
jgi:hypothetical protein